MAVTFNNATVTPLVGAQTLVTTIAGGPFDIISVFVTGGLGGGGGALNYKLYATVGGVAALVAQTQVQGSAASSILQWLKPNDNGPLGGGGDGNAYSQFVSAGGTVYILTVQDLSQQPPPPGAGPRQPISATVAGVNSTDVASDTNASFAVAVPAGAEVSTGNAGGYAQMIDVSAVQTAVPAQTVFTLYANCGAGSVEAAVFSVTVPGPDAVTPLMRKLALPVALFYRVGVKNQSSGPIVVPVALATYSIVPTAPGGVVALLGDVTGPSNANTVVKWQGIALDPVTMTAPADADIPIYDVAGGIWRALLLSQDATMTDAGLVTVKGWLAQPLDPATMGAPAVNDVPVWDGAKWVASNTAGVVTMTGNTIGPSNANRLVALVHEPAAPGPYLVLETAGEVYVGVKGLGANFTVQLPAAGMTPGSKVIVKDEDGSLALWSIIVDGNGHTIDGVATYTMTAPQNGIKGSITVLMNGNAPAEWSVV